jgi:hypothetical protein
MVCPFIVVALGNVFFWFVRFEATALYRVTTGDAVLPARR